MASPEENTVQKVRALLSEYEQFLAGKDRHFHGGAHAHGVGLALARGGGIYTRHD